MLKGISDDERAEYLRKVQDHLLFTTAAAPRSADNLYYLVFGEWPKNKINGTRPLRRLIEELRQSGVPIGSSTGHEDGGYYLITDPVELQEYCSKIKGQGIRKIMQAQRILKQNLPELIGEIQQTLLEEV